MIKMIPPYIGKECKSSGERMVFEMFKNEFSTKDWIILHSLNLAVHSKRLYGEIDFLLMIPHGGIFIIEVKGGDVKCKEGIWEFTDRNGNKNKNRSPFSQAQQAMFSLIEAIRKKFGTYHKFTKYQFGFFVAFPHVEFDVASVEYEDWQIFDLLDVNSSTIHKDNFIKTLVNRYIEKHKNQAWFSTDKSLPSYADLIELSNFLRGDFERLQSTKDNLIEFNSGIKKFTSEQFWILDSIQLNQRNVIRGLAGTGKTLLAMESAIRSAIAGQRVFLTCYNRLIGVWLTNQLSEWNNNIVVSSLHKFLFLESKGFDYDRSEQTETEFYHVYLPNLLCDVYKLGIKKQFDKIIIDEGQDLIRIEYLKLFDAMLIGGLKNGSWEIYGDFERQSIFSDLTQEEMFELLNSYGQFSNFLLKINCRNSKQIGKEIELLARLKDAQIVLNVNNAGPVEYYFYKDFEEECEILIRLLNKFVLDNLPKDELIILSPKKFEKTCAYVQTYFPIEEIQNDSAIVSTKECFRFATIQSFKGMESNFIILTDIDDIKSELSKGLLYIGMSRAKYKLILLISNSMHSKYRELLEKGVG